MAHGIIGTVGHDRSLPCVLSELPATEARRHRSVAERTPASSENFCTIANLALRATNGFSAAEQNATTYSRDSRTPSDNNRARDTARIIRAARLRDLLAAIEEFWRASGHDRVWWRADALWRLREWRRLHAIPERAAFQAAVAAAQHRRATA